MISAVANAGGTAAAARPANPALGQADFIRLLTTQLKQQDPTDPVDNKDMIAQMAQFSSLSGIEKLNSTVERIAARLDRTAPTVTTDNAVQTGAQE